MTFDVYELFEIRRLAQAYLRDGVFETPYIAVKFAAKAVYLMTKRYDPRGNRKTTGRAKKRVEREGVETRNYRTSGKTFKVRTFEIPTD